MATTAAPRLTPERIFITLTAAGFALVMLANTEAGDAYTFAEYEKMFRSAGFIKTSSHPILELPQQVIVAEK